MLRDIMALLAPFKLTPKTALKIYQHFGAACLDLLRKSPFELCQIPGFGFRRVDAIVRKTDNRQICGSEARFTVLWVKQRENRGICFWKGKRCVRQPLNC